MFNLRDTRWDRFVDWTHERIMPFVLLSSVIVLWGVVCWLLGVQ